MAARPQFYLSGWQRDEDDVVLLVRARHEGSIPLPELSSALQKHLLAVNTGRFDSLIGALEEIASRTGIDATLPSKPGWALGDIARAALGETKS